jgi:hypothetical protein
MAIFTGKIIEAYFANSDNSTVEVIYKDHGKAINHYLAVDFNNQDFKDLIKEYDTDKIAEATMARNRNYAKQLSDLIDVGIKSKVDTRQKISVEDFVKKILDFDPSDPACNEILFSLKVLIFENKKVKGSTDNVLKSKMRVATHPIDLLVAYSKLND